MARQDSSADGMRNRPSVEKVGDRELVIARIFDAPPGAVYRAWSQAEAFRRWWVPQSASGVTLVGCDMDVRTGGTYRLEFSAGGADTMTFFGRYLDVVPDERIVWTNDEEDAGAVTTVTFAHRGGATLLTFHELYPSGEARDDALQGGAAALPEQLDQLAALVAGTAG